MNSLLFGCCLLFSVAKAPQGAAVAPTVLAKPIATPESPFVSLCNDVAALLRRALAEPNDTKAVAMLQGSEAAQLLQRQKQLRPGFTKWMNALPPAQRQALAQRMMNNDLMQFMQSVDQNAKANARLERNAKLRNAFTQLVSGMFADKM